MMILWVADRTPLMTGTMSDMTMIKSKFLSKENFNA